VKGASAALALALTLSSTDARAENSEEGPFYVGGSVGVSFWDFPSIQIIGPLSTSYSWTGFDPTIEFGWHPSGRHDGFVIAVRQGFSIDQLQGHAAGTTVARVGWDFAFKMGKLELNVDPFATFGVGYIFDALIGQSGPHAGIQATGGIDAKIFLTSGVFVVVRPAELGFQCLHEYGICAFVYAAGVGAGVAFGK
jgi:hypothetical protein